MIGKIALSIIGLMFAMFCLSAPADAADRFGQCCKVETKCFVSVPCVAVDVCCTGVIRSQAPYFSPSTTTYNSTVTIAAVAPTDQPTYTVIDADARSQSGVIRSQAPYETFWTNVTNYETTPSAVTTVQSCKDSRCKHLQKLKQWANDVRTN